MSVSVYLFICFLPPPKQRTPNELKFFREDSPWSADSFDIHIGENEVGQVRFRSQQLTNSYFFFKWLNPESF